MKRELVVEPEVESLPFNGRDNSYNPRVLTVAELFALDVPKPEMLIEEILSKRGATLAVGSPKAGKTLMAVQAALSVASGVPLFDCYKVLDPGPALIVEQDDPAGASSIKDILLRSTISVVGVPFYLAPRVPFTFGLELLDWMEAQIAALKLHLLVLDSYTALRGSRSSGVDIVKAEQMELCQLDELAKRTGCAVLVVHHGSKGSAGADWAEQAAGTFAMAAATEGQIHISRFRELDSNAPERLIRVRGRHLEGTEMVLRFRKETLDYEHILKGGAAPLYPVVLQLQTVFGTQTFGPKLLAQETGVSRATAHRHIDRLYRAGAMIKRGFGDYAMVGVKQSTP